jgi:Mor family transcriptional regulator
LPRLKKPALSGITRAKLARQRYAEEKKRSIAGIKAGETRRSRARQGVYGKLEQRAQSRRDLEALEREHARVRKLTEHVKQLRDELKRERKIKQRELREQLKEQRAANRKLSNLLDRTRAAVEAIKIFDRYEKAEFNAIARKYRLSASEVYTLWLYH